MSEPWTCPQCGNKMWAEENFGLCVQCGYHAQQAQQMPMPQVPPPATNDVLAHQFLVGQNGQAQQLPTDVMVLRHENEQLKRQHLAYQQQAQEHHQALQEVAKHATQQMQGQMTQAFQQMLQPLVDYWATHKQQVSFEQLIPATVKLLMQFEQIAVPKLAAPLQTVDASQQALLQAILGLTDAVNGMRTHLQPTPPALHDNGYAPSDKQLYQLERDLQQPLKVPGEW